jgi:hypothetical protein
MLCKKVVNFFMLLSHTHETGARKMSITQELLSLVTGLAHYLKILIRIALTGSLKLEREYENPRAIGAFLGRLDRLARDPEANRISKTTAEVARGLPSPSGESITPGTDDAGLPPSRKNSAQSAASSSNGGGDLLPSPSNASNNGGDSSSLSPTTPTPTSSSSRREPYGYKSLTRAVGTLVGQGEATTDLCEGCRLTVEEECARFGTSTRWHLGGCLRCGHCGGVAVKEPSTSSSSSSVGEDGEEKKEIGVRDFVWVEDVSGEDEEGRGGRSGTAYCKECAKRERGGSLEGTRDGFEYVTRLEQYAFLLCVALNKLFGRLKQRGVVPGSPRTFLPVLRLFILPETDFSTRSSSRLRRYSLPHGRLPRLDGYQADEVGSSRP